MYLQITTRCNMRCKHCCYSCTEEGQDMSMEVVKAALKLAADAGEGLTIGGGEPTLHPNFWEIIGLTLGQRYIEYVWMATNGSQTETALSLANLARKGIISVALSQDIYHAKIDPKVVQAFTRESKQIRYGERDDDLREIRNVTGKVIPVGRAEENDIESDRADDECACEDLFITPSGDIKVCGCKESPIVGNVFEPEKFWEWRNKWDLNDGCYRTIKPVEETEHETY